MIYSWSSKLNIFNFQEHKKLAKGSNEMVHLKNELRKLLEKIHYRTSQKALLPFKKIPKSVKTYQIQLFSTNNTKTNIIHTTYQWIRVKHTTQIKTNQTCWVKGSNTLSVPVNNGLPIIADKSQLFGWFQANVKLYISRQKSP